MSRFFHCYSEFVMTFLAKKVQIVLGYVETTKSSQISFAPGHLTRRRGKKERLHVTPQSAATSAANPALLFSSAPPAEGNKMTFVQSLTYCSHVHITSGYHATGARRYPFSLPRVYPPWVLPAPYPPASEFAIFPGGGGRRRHVPASLSSLPPSPPPGGGGGTG